VLLASTAVPMWAASRLLLGPIFVATATATGAAASRLTLVACGLPARHPTRRALRTIETAAIAVELTLSTINERRLGNLAEPMRHGRSGTLFRAAEATVLLGLIAQVLGRRWTARGDDAASVLFLVGGLAFRFAWVNAGKVSAADHSTVAAFARGRSSPEDHLEVGGDPRSESKRRRSLRVVPGQRLWGEVIRRVSLAVESRLPG
jgi:hypothetical protein